LKGLYNNLFDIGLADAGFDSTTDITACPGTDSCNLGISNSTTVALALERVIEKEYPELIVNQDVKIKISGCPNSCGQHGIASIGFHGSSLKNRQNNKVLPALQVLLGGGIKSNGEGFIAEKVIKVPSKKGANVLREILNDYEENGQEGEYFAYYFQRQGKDYFYQLLKPHANLESLEPNDYIDWGKEGNFAVETEVGECAGVIIDLVSTLVFEAEEKIDLGKEAFVKEAFSDSIYHSYSAYINGAKALLTSKGIEGNTHIGIMKLFEENFDLVQFDIPESGFSITVLKINQNEPSHEFAKEYITGAINFVAAINDFLKKEEISELIPQ
jgi:sulfite reductase (ferredoxin)